MDGTNIDPYLPLLHAHPQRQQKSPAEGKFFFIKQHIFDDVLCFVRKKLNKSSMNHYKTNNILISGDGWNKY